MAKKLETNGDARELAGMDAKMPFRSFLAAILAGALGLSQVSSAQTMVRTQDYLRDLVSLSEVLGKTHAIRMVCRGRASQEWRVQMQTLLELEAPYQGGVRRSMVNGFNAGFSTGSSDYEVCNREAMETYRALAEEGRTLANSLAGAAIRDGSRN